jgi:hypothetical protein
MLEAIWKLYPARRSLLMPYRMWLGPGFLVLAIVMASASIGCFRRRIWGWWLAIAIFVINGATHCRNIAPKLLVPKAARCIAQLRPVSFRRFGSWMDRSEAES